jgi:hypothetical protein
MIEPCHFHSKQLKVVNLAKTYQFVAEALTFDFTYKKAWHGGYFKKH